MLRSFLQVGAWLVAAVWLARMLPAVAGLRRVPDLLRLAGNCVPEGNPLLVVVVPAKDEAAHIEATLRSLLEQDYANLRVIAVNDRSTDGTGGRMDAVAASAPGRLSVLHVRVLPDGWAGKVHAMTMGARLAVDAEYLLFTDGDVFFERDALRRALTVAVSRRADHFVCLPTLRVRRWDEGVLLAVFHALGGLAVRLWKVEDAQATRDVVGVGAFNLVRREAFERVGGFAAEPLAIVEDLRLGQRMKAAGMRPVVAFGAGLVQVHWASGALGIVRTVTKNFFAVLQFNVAATAGAAVFIVAMFWLPVVGLCVPGLRVPAVLAMAAMAVGFALSGPRTGVSGWYGLLSPVGALGVAGALLWSALTTLRQGGIRWRGTFYSLAELRRQR